MLKNTKILLIPLGMLCALMSDFVIVPQALAQSPVADTQQGIMIAMLNAVAILNSASFILIKILGSLADPSALNLDKSVFLIRLWRISRDIMNLIFIVMLLAGAIMTIIFAKQDLVKQHIVKFIFAVVLVNFSWFFPRVILDVANVTTATIYSLPSLIDSECQWKDKSGTPHSCAVVENVLFPGEERTKPCNGIAPSDAAGGTSPYQDMMDFTILKVCLDPLNSDTNTAYGIINGLAVNHGRMMYLSVVAPSQPGGGIGDNGKQILMASFMYAFITFLHVLLVFPLAALSVAMIVRIPILWLTIAFMPLMFIGFIIGEKFIRINTMTIFTKHFMTAAFLPALVAVPFSIGFIIENELVKGGIPTPPSLADEFPLIAQVNDWGTMIWVIMAFGIMWIGSFWAMKSDDIYAKFTEPIHQVGNSFLKLPLHIPLPADVDGKNGIEKGEGYRIADLGMLRRPEALSSMLTGKSPFGGGTATNPIVNDTKSGDSLKKFANDKTMPELEKKLLEDIRNALRSMKKDENSRSAAMDLIKAMDSGQKLGIDAAAMTRIESDIHNKFTAK